MPQVEYFVFDSPQRPLEKRSLAVESFDNGYFIDLTLANVFRAQQCWRIERMPLAKEKTVAAFPKEDITGLVRAGYIFYFKDENMFEKLGIPAEEEMEIYEQQRMQITERTGLA